MESDIYKILNKEEQIHRYPFHDNIPYLLENASYILDLFRENDIKNNKIDINDKLYRNYIYQALKSYNEFIKIFLNIWIDLKHSTINEQLNINENGSIKINENDDNDENDGFINKFINPINTAAFYNDIETTQHLLNKGWQFTEYCTTLCFNENIKINYRDDGLENPNIYYKWSLENNAPLPKTLKFLKNHMEETQLIVFSLMKNYKFENDDELNLFLLKFNKHLQPHRDSWNDFKESPFDKSRYDFLNMLYDYCLENKYVRKILFNIENINDYVYIKKYISFKLEEINNLKKLTSKLPLTKDIINYCINPFF